MLKPFLKTVCVVLLLGSTAATLAAPKAELWSRWLAHDPASTRHVDHSAWNALLMRYVRAAPDGGTRFAYAAVSAADRARLDAYLQRLAETPVSSLDRDGQYAYWVNLYNALTVRVVLDHYPVRSIRDIDISPGLFADGPWGAKLVTVEGQALSLDDIEHRILRPIWNDPRTHYALSCAAIGCPDLVPEAFTPENRDRLLTRGARAYVNNPRGVSIDAEGRIAASSLYDWYRTDFGADTRAVLEYLARLAEPPLAERLRKATDIDRYDYDWSLNDAGR